VESPDRAISFDQGRVKRLQWSVREAGEEGMRTRQRASALKKKEPANRLLE
jgi:hypothetical protein